MVLGHPLGNVVATINLSPPEPVLDARQLGDLIRLWLAHGVANRDTAAGYEYKVRYFCDWWLRRGPAQQWRLGRRDLDAFGAYLETARTKFDLPLAYHTRNDILRRLRQALRWAYRGGYVEHDYSVWVPQPGGEPVPRTAAETDALRRLLLAADQTPFPARARTILAVLIGTGIRRSECATIQIEDIRLYADHSGVMAVTGKRTKANHSGRRTVALDAETGTYLVAYLDMLRRDKGPLFCGPNGAALTPQTIYRTVKKCVGIAGLEEEIIGCHDLRRAFATHVARRYRGEVYGDLLRRQMGHKTYRMTAHYSLLDADDIRDSLKSPLAFLAE